MLPLHPLSMAIQADRERDIRDHMPKPIGLPTAHRRPAIALSVETPWRGSGSRSSATRPRVATAGQG